MLLDSVSSFASLVPFRGLALVVPLQALAQTVITTVVFVIIGLIVFALAFLVIAKSTPFSVRKEIEEDHNVALAIVIAAVILGSALIIAAAIHG
jgi:putative membrane protein